MQESPPCAWNLRPGCGGASLHLTFLRTILLKHPPFELKILVVAAR